MSDVVQYSEGDPWNIEIRTAFPAVSVFVQVNSEGYTIHIKFERETHCHIVCSVLKYTSITISTITTG